VFFRVLFRCVFMVLSGMQVMSMSHFRVVRSLFVIASFAVLCGLVMVLAACSEERGEDPRPIAFKGGIGARLRLAVDSQMPRRFWPANPRRNGRHWPRRSAPGIAGALAWQQHAGAALIFLTDKPSAFHQPSPN
jgi:hypothetical protein